MFFFICVNLRESVSRKFGCGAKPRYEILETEYEVSVTQARQSLEAVIATEYEAGLLQVQPGAPLMLERRSAFDPSGQPVEHGRDLYRGDRFRFVTETAPIESWILFFIFPIRR